MCPLLIYPQLPHLYNHGLAIFIPQEMGKKKKRKAPKVSSNKGEVNILRGERHFNFKNTF
jgi:hypothetical protein